MEGSEAGVHGLLSQALGLGRVLLPPTGAQPSPLLGTGLLWLGGSWGRVWPVTFLTRWLAESSVESTAPGHASLGQASDLVGTSCCHVAQRHRAQGDLTHPGSVSEGRVPVWGEERGELTLHPPI